MHSSARPTGFRAPGPVSVLWLLTLVSVGGILRFTNLNSDLWLDEIGTLVTYVRLPLSQIVQTYGSMNQHLLYSLLGHLSVRALGESAWALRLPAALFGIAAIPALYYMARAITSEREALLASAMLTFSYHHIWFSQDARGYSAMVLFALLGTGFLIRALAEGTAIFWVGYVLAMTLGVVSLQNTLFVVAGQWVCCTVLLGWKLDVRLHLSVLAVGLLSLLCHSLMLTQMLVFMGHTERTGLGWTSVTQLLPVISQGLVAGFGLVGLAALGLIGVAGWRSYWRQTHVLAGVLVVPIVLNVAILLVLRIGAYPRSFLYELPFAFLIVVRGATVLCRRFGGERGATILCLLLTAVACIPLVRYYALPKQNFSGALAYVQSHKKTNDIVMAADLAGTCYRRYYDPSMVIATDSKQIEALQREGHDVWVLYSFPREFQLRSPELFRYLRSQLSSAAIFHGTLGGGDLYVAKTEAR